ncbi:MAG: dioxygenase [Pseudomonadales bacterium]|nr:dioxygenase [Pseudomonadales bacterium]
MKHFPVSESNAPLRASDGSTAPGAPGWTADIDNPYLHGIYAPSGAQFERARLDVVEGEIPEDLYGMYVRNGPNPVFKPRFKHHPFDGDGMLYAVYFENGCAHYSNRHIETKAFLAEAKNKASIWPGVMGPFDFDLPDFPIKDTSHTDVMFFNKHLLTLWYNAGIPYRLNAKSLSTTGREDLSGQLRRAMSAHSKVDPANGELVFFDYFDTPPYMRYGIADSQGNVIHDQAIKLPGPRLPHDIGVTPNYVVLHDLPFYHDVALLEKTGKRVMTFHRDVPARFGVQPRYGKGDEVRWFECEPCYILHVINCWEEGDWLVQVGCRSTNPMPKANPEDGELSHMLAYMRLEANLYLWKFNLKTGEVIERDIDTLNAEFPRSNPLYMGYKSQFCYSQYICTRQDDGIGTLAFGALLKYNIETGEYQRFDYGEGVYGNEAPFCPKPGATRAQPEDDGYLVTTVTDSKDWQSYTLIFDAKNIVRGPICKLRMPHRAPFGFHTNWVAGEDVFS